MSIGDELAKHVATEQLPPVRSRRKAAPKGWEPGVVWNGDSGQIITDPVPADELLTHERLLVDAGFDPATYEIVGDLQWREWDAAIGDGQVQRFRYWKANLRQKIAAGPDVADLIRLVRRHRPRRPPGRTAQSTLVVPLADWQIGKADGDGTAGSVDRVLRTVDSISAEIRRLKPTRLLVAGMGDLVEGCTGFYPAQEWQTELNRRDQEKLVREMLTKQLTTWAKLVDEVLVVCVGGNHGENRLGNGRTTDADRKSVV